MLRILFCFVLLLVFNFCQGQNEFGKNNFFEIGFNIKTPSESNFLKNSDLDENFGNPLVDLIGVQALNRAQEIGVNIKYGHQIFKNFQFISQVGYSRRIEKITCWCHFCEKLSFNNGLKINSIELGEAVDICCFRKKILIFQLKVLVSILLPWIVIT